MLTIKPRFETFEEYLVYEDNSEKLYELFNRELIEVPPESGFNIEIANFLFLKFAQLVGYRRVRGHGLELEVRGEPKNRYPDLTIIREEHIQQLSKRNTICLNMAPPLVVMEIISPGQSKEIGTTLLKECSIKIVVFLNIGLLIPKLKRF